MFRYFNSRFPLNSAPPTALVARRRTTPAVPSKVFTLTSALASGLTYARADTGTRATVTDSSGKLQLIAANLPRFDYTTAGVALGMLFEEARTNLCTNTNVSPAATTNLSVTGDATVASVSDTTAIATAKLDAINAGNVIEAAGGAGGGTVVIAGATGATGGFSVSLYARVTAGSSATAGISPVPAGVTISGSAYARFKGENLTATNSADTMVITLPAGVTIRFILNQLEAGKFCTSVIKVAGSSGARIRDLLQYTGLASAPWWNPNRGCVIVSCNPYQDNNQTNAAGIFVAGSAEDAFPDEAIYLQTNASSNKLNPFGKHSNVATSSSGSSTLTGIIAGRKNPCGINYINGNYIQAFAGPMVYGSQVSMTSVGGAISIDTLTIGSFASGTLNFNGWIDNISFFKRPLTMREAAPYCLGSRVGFSERGIIGGGQSLMQNNSAAATTLTDEGELAYISALNTILGTSTRNWFINGATTTTAISDWQGSGTAIAKWKTIADAYLAVGGVIDGFAWDQGESNIGNTLAQFKTAYLAIAQDMKSYLVARGCSSTIKCILQPMGRYRLDATEATNINVGYHHQAYEDLVTENPTLFCLAPEKSFNPLQDGLVHLTGAGHATQAPLIVRKFYKDTAIAAVSGAVDGPTVGTPTLAVATVTVPIVHNADGTDFTPTSAIGGFQFYDNSVLIANTSVVRTDATHITIVLASTPSSGTYELRYANGTIYNNTGSTLVRDNSTYQLPLRAGKWTVA